jgi:hypothetical protein
MIEPDGRQVVRDGRARVESQQRLGRDNGAAHAGAEDAQVDACAWMGDSQPVAAKH